MAGGALDDALTQIGEQIRSSGSEAVVQPIDQARQGTGEGAGSVSLPELRDNLPAWVLWALAFAACAAALLEPRLRRAAVVIALVLGAVLLRVKLASYEFAYQYYSAVPAMAGALALGTAALWPRRALRPVALAAVVLALPLGGYVIRPQVQLLGKDPAARLESAARAVPVADFVRAQTAPGEPIFVAGGRAEVYWRAERRAPTRFFDVHGLTSADDVAERDRDLARTPPAAVAVVSPDRLSDDPGLERLVMERGYELAYDAAGSRVWTRTSVHP